MDQAKKKKTKVKVVCLDTSDKIYTQNILYHEIAKKNGVSSIMVFTVSTIYELEHHNIYILKETLPTNILHK